MRWQRPVYNRYTLYPPNHTSVLIHWRYQVALLKHLNGPDIDTYLNFGLDFMTDPDNLEVPSRRERKTLMVRSLLNVQPPQPEWDEAKTEDESGVITMDVCGEPDELGASGSTEEEVIQRKVTIGSQNYTLVLRGTTLDISGEVHSRSPSPEETTEPEDNRSMGEVYSTFDFHFHLDRSSKTPGEPVPHHGDLDRRVHGETFDSTCEPDWWNLDLLRSRVLPNQCAHRRQVESRHWCTS